MGKLRRWRLDADIHVPLEAMPTNAGARSANGVQLVLRLWEEAGARAQVRRAGIHLRHMQELRCPESVIRSWSSVERCAASDCHGSYPCNSSQCCHCHCDASTTASTSATPAAVYTERRPLRKGSRERCQIHCAFLVLGAGPSIPATS